MFSIPTDYMNNVYRNFYLKFIEETKTKKNKTFYVAPKKFN